ncbi:MAG: Hsp20/alpha crystallin family protein [Anaerolineae bacterium]|nr:MAG: Hsp20/alpha crystallin family protein [Anaerolineae bacterium]
MANLIRWEPFRESRQLHEMLDRFMERALYTDPWFNGSGAERLPLDVLQTEDEFVITANIPGIKPEDVDVSVSGDVLTIRGEVTEEKEEGGEGKTYLLRERRLKSFSRSVTLPVSVNADKAEAKFKDGVLTLTLPKVEEVKPKRIAVKAR